MSIITPVRNTFFSSESTNLLLQNMIQMRLLSSLFRIRTVYRLFFFVIYQTNKINLSNSEESAETDLRRSKYLFSFLYANVNCVNRKIPSCVRDSKRGQMNRNARVRVSARMFFLFSCLVTTTTLRSRLAHAEDIAR